MADSFNVYKQNVSKQKRKQNIFIHTHSLIRIHIYAHAYISEYKKLASIDAALVYALHKQIGIAILTNCVRQH